MARDTLTICHVPTGEKFIYECADFVRCTCGEAASLGPDSDKVEFDYKTKVVSVKCPACSKTKSTFLAPLKIIEAEV